MTLPKTPLDRIPEQKRHRYERIVLATREVMDHRKRLIKDFIEIDGRPAFMIPLTAEEQRQRVSGVNGQQSMQDRIMQANQIIKDRGLKGARDYLDQIREAARNA